MKLIAFAIKHTMEYPAEFRCGGWGNGYVAIPKGHPFFGLDCDTIEEKYYISVHGGLTFCGMGSLLKHLPEQYAQMWIIGFDTCHAYDDLQRWPDQESVLMEANRLLDQVKTPKRRWKSIRYFAWVNYLLNVRNR